MITPPDAGYDRYLEEQAKAWLHEAAAASPGCRRHAHARALRRLLRRGPARPRQRSSAPRTSSSAPPTAGCAAATASASVATELLHSVDVPVVLAPEGSRRIDPRPGVTRITAAIGTRPGADALLEESVALAAATGAELRLLSLVSVDLPASVDTGVIRIAGAAHADDVLAKALAELPDGVDADVVVARGDSIEDAVSQLSWEPGELADRRLEPPRAAAPALPRLDRGEDAARASRPDDRGARARAAAEGESR